MGSQVNDKQLTVGSNPCRQIIDCHFWWLMLHSFVAQTRSVSFFIPDLGFSAAAPGHDFVKISKGLHEIENFFGLYQTPRAPLPLDPPVKWNISGWNM